MKTGLIPTKSQWNRWTLPSKLTAIGAYLTFISLIFTFLIFIGHSYDDIQNRKPKNLLIKHEWVCKNIPTFLIFLEYTYGDKKDEIIDKEFYGIDDSNQETILFMSKLLNDGILTYGFKENNTYYIKSFFDNKKYQSKYNLQKIDNNLQLIFHEQVDSTKIRTSMVELVSINDNKFVINFPFVKNDTTEILELEFYRK